MGRIFFVTGAIAYFQSISPPRLKGKGAVSSGYDNPAAKGDKSKGERGEVLRFWLPSEAMVFV
jgi:hypothetical protein